MQAGVRTRVTFLKNSVLGIFIAMLLKKTILLISGKKLLIFFYHEGPGWSDDNVLLVDEHLR